MKPALTLLASLALLSGCAHHGAYSSAEDESRCKEVKPGTISSVNSMCVIMNEDPVDPELKPVDFKGQKVGFCCAGCIPKWNKMSDTEKSAALAKAVAIKKK